MNISRRSIAVSIGAALVLIIIAIVLVFSASVRDSESAEIIVQTAPKEATVEFTNDSGELVKKVENGAVSLPVGTYQVTVTMDGFDSETVERTLVKDAVSDPVYISLAPSDGIGSEKYDIYREDYLELEGLVGSEIQRRGSESLGNDSKLYRLPIRENGYVIGYRLSEDQSSYVVTIDAESAPYRYLALQDLAGKGFTLGDYEYEFTQFENPLEEDGNNE